MIIKNPLKVNDKYTYKNLAINAYNYSTPLDNIKMNHIFVRKVMEKKTATYNFSNYTENRIIWRWYTLICNMTW